MTKTFYTEYDIEDLFKRGVMMLEVNDNTVLTDLAYEKARRLGMNLSTGKAENPPAAPVRPYLAAGQTVPIVRTLSQTEAVSVRPTCCEPSQTTKLGETDLRRRIQDAVTARLGTQVDTKLLDVIITRVLSNTGIK